MEIDQRHEMSDEDLDGNTEIGKMKNIVGFSM